jgi:MSHA pilin protein MshC
VELVVALAVLAIVAAIALPRSFNRDPFAARGYAVEVAGAARLARAIAMASGCPVRLTIDGSGYRAQQRQVQGTHCAAAGGFTTAVSRTDGTTVQGTLPATLAFSGNLQWTFNSDSTVQLTGGNSATFDVHVISADSQTGLIAGP